MKASEKRALLARLIEHKVHAGLAIDDLLCRPLNYFDYKKVQNTVIEADRLTNNLLNQ